MISLATQLQKKLDDSQMLTEADDSHAVAKYLRAQMKAKATEEILVVKSSVSCEFSMNYDADHMTISYQETSNRIPDELYNHIAWLMTDMDPCDTQEGRVSLPKAIHEKVINISQDLITNVTGLPMPKQVGLVIHVIKQLRCKYLVRLLNWLGHSVSYD